MLLIIPLFVCVCVCEWKHTPPKTTLGQIGLRRTTSRAGEQFMLKDCKANVRAKGVLCFPPYRYHVTRAMLHLLLFPVSRVFFYFVFFPVCSLPPLSFAPSRSAPVSSSQIRRCLQLHSHTHVDINIQFPNACYYFNVEPYIHSILRVPSPADAALAGRLGPGHPPPARRSRPRALMPVLMLPAAALYRPRPPLPSLCPPPPLLLLAPLAPSPSLFPPSLSPSLALPLPTRSSRSSLFPLSLFP